MQHRTAVALTLVCALAGCPEGTTPTEPVEWGPVASFQASPTIGLIPLTVRFTDTSDPGTTQITSHAWEFGDGQTSTDQNPQHSYTSPGKYTVRLTVTAPERQDTMIKDQYIDVRTGVGPIADFTAEPRAGYWPLLVQFTDLSDPGGSPITNWVWNFGDGQRSNEQHPQHMFSSTNEYTVSLTVYTADGSDTETKTDYIDVNRQLGPQAEFEAAPRVGLGPPFSVEFTDLSDPGSAAIHTWIWDFGDGTTSWDQHPEHTYEAANTYDVTLRVYTNHGESERLRSDYIVIRPVDFVGDPLLGQVPMEVQFTDLTDYGSETIHARLWDFGDSYFSTDIDPVHTYDTPGRYTVSLTLTTPNGDVTTSKENYVSVTALPAPTPYSNILLCAWVYREEIHLVFAPLFIEPSFRKAPDVYCKEEPPPVVVDAVEIEPNSYGVVTTDVHPVDGITRVSPGLPLVFDSSGSMADSDPERLRVDAGKHFVSRMWNEDKAAVFDFGLGCSQGFEATRLLQTFTSNKTALTVAMDRLGEGLGTPMYTSLLEVVEYCERIGVGDCQRRVILLLGDGMPQVDDREEAVDAIIDTGTRVIAVGLGPASEYGPGRLDRAVNNMKNLAYFSEGLYIPLSGPEQAEGVFDCVADGLFDNQYELTITLSAVPAIGEEILVMVDTSYGRLVAYVSR